MIIDFTKHETSYKGNILKVIIDGDDELLDDKHIRKTKNLIAITSDKFHFYDCELWEAIPTDDDKYVFLFHFHTFRKINDEDDHGRYIFPAKCLGVNIYFALPDDFEGGYEEAIFEYLKYRRERKLSSSQPDMKSNMTYEDMGYYHELGILDINKMWEEFGKSVAEGLHSLGFYSLMKFNDKTGIYDQMP